MWRRRVRNLRPHLDILQSTRYAFAYNCPPYGMIVDPWTRPCRIAHCPNCWGRKVGQLFTKVRNHVKGRSCSVLAVQMTLGSQSDHELDVVFDPWGSVYGSVREAIQVGQEQVRFIRKTYFNDSTAGFSNIAIWPERAWSAGATGIHDLWYMQLSFVAVLPAKAELRIHGSPAITNPSDHSLSEMIGNAFRYPRAWLRADPHITSEFLENSRRTKFLSPWGHFKRVKFNTEHSAPRALQAA